MAQQHVDELTAFGIALRTIRQRAGLSQDQLAHISGLHRTYVGSVERGERNVGLLNLHVLARALDMTLADLMGVAEQIQENPKKSKKGR